MTPQRELLRARCAICDRILGAYIPKGGDGTQLFVRCHNGIETMCGITTITRTECPGGNRSGGEVTGAGEDKP